jgi:RNA polymerase sigma factor for flagellar operon FliA
MERPECGRGIEGLAESHLDYAHAIAAEMLKTLPSTVDRADVESAAGFGLMQAAATYDPSRGVSFATFAYNRVRGAIYDDLRKIRANRFGESANTYMIDYSSAPPLTPDPDAEYREVKRITSHIVTSYLLSRDLSPREPVSPSMESPLELLLRKERHYHLREALTRLPEKNRKVIESYYFAGLSFSQIGRDLGLSESSAWRIHAKSLEMIRAVLEEKRLSRTKRPRAPGVKREPKTTASIQSRFR